MGGALTRPVSPYEACKAESDGCFKLLRNPFYLGDQPGGTQVAGWLDAWSPQQSAYAVGARNAADVAAAVDFARRHDLRLAIKGGGHSYQGTSNAADSLLIWTRAMHDIELHDAFIPRGCAGRAAGEPAVSVGAGAIWIDAYDAVTTRAGRYVQGGGCTTVGVAGHIQSGGFGSFSKGFGLAAASLIEAEVVTADGVVRVVNACRHPDLYWALKGGGGGGFGVVTRMTLRTHELPRTFGWAELDIKATDDGAYRRLIDKFMAFYAKALLNPHWGEQAHIRHDNILQVRMVSQGLSDAEATDVWRPFLAFVAASPHDYTLSGSPQIGVAPARRWWDAEARRKAGDTSLVGDGRSGAPSSHAFWRGDQDQAGAYLHAYDSVWLPAALLRPSAGGRLANALFNASRASDVELHFNKGLAGAPKVAIERASDTPINPVALDAFALAIVARGGLPPLPWLPKPDFTQAHRNVAAVAEAAAALRKAVPQAGSYVAESDFFNADWKRAFWGRNYARLKGVKARYDPKGLFFAHHGVGSEDWSADGFARLS